MTAQELITSLIRAGHTITVDGEKIHVTPAVEPGPIRALKPEVLELFARQAQAMRDIRGHDECQQTARLDTPWGEVWMVPAVTPRSGRFEVSWASLADDPRGALDRARTVLLAATMTEGKVICH